MNRRDALKALLAAAPALAAVDLDIERLLWVPKPMVTVPAMPTLIGVDYGVEEWQGVMAVVDGTLTWYPQRLTDRRRPEVVYVTPDSVQRDTLTALERRLVLRDIAKYDNAYILPR